MRIPENMIEFSPLSIKGQKALSKLVSAMRKHNVSEEVINMYTDENHFLDEFYIEPFTRINERNWAEDYITVEDKDVYNVEILQKSKQDFEHELTTGLIKLVWLYGNAGCGKSTYVHRLGQEYKDSMDTHYYDFEEVKKACIIKYQEGNGIKKNRIGNDELWKKSSLFRFFILIIDKIIDSLCLCSSNFLESVNNIKKIIEEHKKSYDEENDFQDVVIFFESLEKIIYQNTYLEGIKEIITYFNNIVQSFESNQEQTENTSLITLSCILLNIMLYKGAIKNKTQICVFDNIEYMVSFEYSDEKVLITDRTIEIILNSIHTAVSHCLSKTTKFAYHNCPKIVFVTRRATVAFNGNLEMNNYQSVEITNWFCAKEIYEKKTRIVSEYTEEGDKLAYDIFNLIMSDCTMSKWSLVPFLSKLFNYNMRRMARILIHILIINTASKNGNEKNTLEKFKILWDKNLNPDEYIQKQIKHFLRMYIIRLVLDSFNGYPREISGQNVAYFNKLMVELGKIADYETISIPPNGKDLLDHLTENKYGNLTNVRQREEAVKKYITKKRNSINEIETSFARRILTILHRAEIENLYSGNNKSIININYFNFEDLLKNLLLDGNTQHITSIDAKTISTIANILFLMNEVTDSTGWVPLTSIKWKNSEEKYTLSAIESLLQNAVSNIKSHNYDFSVGIRITPAGQAFLKLLPDFEYFAARFCPLEPKLLSDKSLCNVNGKFPCINTINKILYYSIKCIYTIIKRAEIEYSSLGANAEIDFDRMFISKSLYKETNLSPVIAHPLRIFSQQINYFYIFLNYIQSLDPNEDRFKTDDEKNKLIQELELVINTYKDWQIYFNETYHDFLYRRNN